MKIGVIGAGFMGGVHLESYAKMSGVEVVGVADVRPGIAAAGAEVVGARAYSSYEELVGSEDLDLVDVCLPTTFHRELALKAARDGKHVFLEKPIARTLEEAREILRAFEDNGSKLFVGHVVRFFPEYVRLKEMVAGGEFGTVGVVRASRRSPFLVGWNDWYADRLASGGPMLDLLIHDFDFLRWTFGEVERVFAKSAFEREYNRMDYTLVTLRFAGGEIAHVEGHWGYPAPFCYSMEIAGSRKFVEVNSEKNARLRVIGGRVVEGNESPDIAGGKSPYQLQLEHFVRCLSTGEEPVVGGEDAYAALRISLAAMESVQTGKPVRIG